MTRPLRIAHRGMPRRLTENTLPSFAAAIAAGADGIELDVHATADGVVIVHHDPTLAGREISLTPCRELQALELAPGVHVPTLSDVCSLIGGAAELFVEIKGNGIEMLVVEALSDYDGPAAIHSFDHALIGRLARCGMRHRLGLLYDDRPSHVTDDMRTLGSLDIWPERGLVTQRLIEEVHDVGGR